ncbi:MAG: hypothetical protein KDA29_14960, partial [Phycisphaerales bacterium]|nr:hypothetical protein [Phycisphaerales bacterium]
ECCCGGGQCYLILLACGCDCVEGIAAIPLDAATDAAWPADQREAGAVIETATGCWRLLGSSTSVPNGALDPGDIIAIHPSCDDAPCPPGPCPNTGESFALTNGATPCLPFSQGIQCIRRVRVAWSMAGYYQSREELGSGEVFENAHGYAAGEYEYEQVGSVLQLSAFSFTNRLVGVRDTTAAGGTSEDWDIAQSVDQDTPGTLVGSPVPQGAGYTIIVPRLATSGVVSRASFGDDLGFFIDFTPCNESIDFDFSGDSGPVGRTSHNGIITPSQTTSNFYGWVNPEGDNRESYRVGVSIRIRIVEYETVDGRTVRLDDCDQPVPSIATACSPDADPQEFVYDAQLAPEWAVAIVNPDNDERYILTGTPTEQATSDGVFINEGCISQPTLWPLARECGGSRVVTYDPAMRPPNGVTFMVGSVRYTPIAGESTEAPSSGTWSPDPCPSNPCAGLIPNDPRCNDPRFRDCPQCVGFNVGDPIIIPTDPRGSTPPDNNGMIEALMSPIMRCKGCGG